ncbi:MAG: hypothetical protein J6A30_09390 [Ruminococcus sp.]|nr:hypothetical protein [Ruminococcus sp.]
MALTDEGMGTTMLMQPAYGAPYSNGGFGFGGDFMSWILLILVLGGGWGGFGGFGMGGMMGAGMWGMMDGFGLYPWMNQVNQMNDGFRDQQLNATAQGIQNAVTSGFGNVQLGIAGVNQNICQTGNGVISAVTGAQNAISQQMYTNELASLNRSFAEQAANQQGFNGVQAGIADLRYTEATEGCATRNAAAQNTRDIVDAIRSGDQMIMDKLCALELDGVKSQLAQAQRENVGLQNQVNMATTRAENLANADNIVNSLYSRLSSCPTPSIPVAGNTPLFSCNPSFNSPNTGCGCNGGF